MTDERKFTGWHALAVFGGAFAVIIGVNITLAVQAVRTFPGLEVKNSYVASQDFDRRRAAQDALGWQTEAALSDGRLVLSIRDAGGLSVQPASLTAVLGRAAHGREDQELVLAFDGTRYAADVVAGPGNWVLMLSAVAADGTEFERKLGLYQRN
jgi:nitrogen fixation protein FixH